jgi:hypothetical protein
MIWLYMGTTGILSDLVYHFGGLDGPTILFLATLGAITIFRREMSCNHCYVEEPSTDFRIGERTEDDEISSKDWNDEETEELLEGAGRYCSGALLAPVIDNLLKILHGKGNNMVDSLFNEHRPQTTEEILDAAGCYCSGIPLLRSFFRSRPPRSIRVISFSHAYNQQGFLSSLPLDAQIHMLSFLHPRDIVNVACVNKACSRLIDEGPSSSLVWKTLWKRDYAWLVEYWDIGRLAKERSGIEPTFNKDFYFRFSLASTNYLLAGQNNYDRCLVGIGGHIYDLSLFLAVHPGSPETVMAHAGQDATDFFARINHSAGARQIAKSHCVVVDLAFVDPEDCGAKPTKAISIDECCTYTAPAQVDPPSTYHSNTLITKRPTLERIRDEFLKEESAHKSFASSMDIAALLGDVNVYYDPLAMKWKAWYTSKQFERIFMDFNNTVKQ